jgi:hypothetical protein
MEEEEEEEEEATEEEEEKSWNIDTNFCLFVSLFFMLISQFSFCSFISLNIFVFFGHL